MKNKLTQRDIAGILRVDTKTLYNWRKNKPELYKIVMLGFKVDEFLAKTKENIEELEMIINEKEIKNNPISKVSKSSIKM